MLDYSEKERANDGVGAMSQKVEVAVHRLLTGGESGSVRVAEEEQHLSSYLHGYTIVYTSLHSCTLSRT